jgi:hypothetical protein
MNTQSIKKSLSRLNYLLDKIKKNNRKDFWKWNGLIEEMPSIIDYYENEEKDVVRLTAVTNMFNFDFSLFEDVKKAKAKLNEIIKYGLNNNQLEVEQIKNKINEDIKKVERKIQSIERYGNTSTKTTIVLNYK